jgi:peptide/nickel transport system substrate-binding protein
LARPKPAAPSSRVYAAFAIAAIIGVATFLIWWITSDARLRRASGATSADGSGSAAAPASPPTLSKEAIIESALPRGGSLTGSTDVPALASERLTAATLVRINRSTDDLEPWLAESWIPSEGNLIYTVKLRPGLTSADGAALTAADAAQSLGAIEAAGQPVTVRVLDPLTLELRFGAPFAPGLRLLDRRPIQGFGPFVEDPPDAKRSGPRTFKRNPRYWRKAANGSSLPYLDELVLASSLPGPAQAGEHDFADSPVRVEDVEALKKLEQSGKARLFELGPGLDADALWFAPAASASAASPLRRDKDGSDNDRPWLGSETLRLAISAAVNRREYCKQVFYGACDPMAGPVSPANAAWFNPDFPLGQANAQLARAMLAESGLRDRTGDGILDDAARRPLRFSLLIRRDVPSAARAAAFLAGTLKEIGVLVDVTPLAPEALAARRQKGNYDAMYDRIEVRDTDPAMNLDFWLSSGAANVWNPARVGPPADWERQIDQLMLKNAATFDRVERLQAFVDAQKIYLQHLPAIFFGTPHVRIVTSVRVLNATPSPLRPHVLWNAENLAALK